MDAVDRPDTAWEAEDYLTSLDRLFEFDTMDESVSYSVRDSFVADWNLRRAA